MMNPEIKQKWVEALRSGRYQQGQRRLRNGDNTYCCLGVLCDVYHKETGNGTWVDPILVYASPSYTFRDTEEIAYYSHLPETVAEWAGLTSDATAVAHLMDLNDGNLPTENGECRPRAFDAIADFIEEHL